MPQLPTPLRAAVGLAAEVADQARHLPDRAIELPMLAISTALQLSLRAQQRYALYAARGDEVLNSRPATDEPPEWATFDDPPTEVSSGLTALDGGAGDNGTEPVRAVKRPGRATGRDAADGTGKRARASAATGSADGATPRARRSTQPRKSAKSVQAPRNAPPSRFDTVGDDTVGDD